MSLCENHKNYTLLNFAVERSNTEAIRLVLKMNGTTVVVQFHFNLSAQDSHVVKDYQPVAAGFAVVTPKDDLQDLTNYALT